LVSGGSSFVVAVSGASGAGKTTLVHALAARGSGTALFYDDYYRAPGVWTCDLPEWIAAGCDPNSFIRIPHLVEDLRSLRAGRPVVSPAGRRSEPAALIVLEEPWGRQRAEIAALIDFAIHLRLPPEVALARKLLREGRAGADILPFLADYLGKQIYRIYEAQEQAGACADFVLDATMPTNGLEQAAWRAVRAACQEH
jgi:uridine kinase